MIALVASRSSACCKKRPTANSIVIGDKVSDIEMGRAVGALTFLVRTGYGARFENEVAADYVVDDLATATESLRCLVTKARSVTSD